MVKDKLILREIAKRWCKGIIWANEALVSFSETGLTQEEIDYIQEESNKIMHRITDKPISHNVEELVNEYYD
jgi:hypothetical protein